MSKGKKMNNGELAEAITRARAIAEEAWKAYRKASGEMEKAYDAYISAEAEETYLKAHDAYWVYDEAQREAEEKAGEAVYRAAITALRTSGAARAKFGNKEEL